MLTVPLWGHTRNALWDCIRYKLYKLVLQHMIFEEMTSSLKLSCVLKGFSFIITKQSLTKKLHPFFLFYFATVIIDSPKVAVAPIVLLLCHSFHHKLVCCSWLEEERQREVKKVRARNKKIRIQLSQRCYIISDTTILAVNIRCKSVFID